MPQPKTKQSESAGYGFIHYQALWRVCCLSDDCVGKDVVISELGFSPPFKPLPFLHCTGHTTILPSFQGVGQFGASLGMLYYVKFNIIILHNLKTFLSPPPSKPLLFIPLHEENWISDFKHYTQSHRSGFLVISASGYFNSSHRSYPFNIRPGWIGIINSVKIL